MSPKIIWIVYRGYDGAHNNPICWKTTEVSANRAVARLNKKAEKPYYYFALPLNDIAKD